jgi:hypothetical protein
MLFDPESRCKVCGKRGAGAWSHHHHAMNASAAEPAPPPQVGWMGGLNSGDHTMYLQNLHDSGYNPKNNFNAAGNIAD